MLTVAYLANQYPSAVEPYVWEEVEELQRRGVEVVTGSIRKPHAERAGSGPKPNLVLQDARGIVLLRALALCLWKWSRLWPLVARVVLQGEEGAWQGIKALLHTFLGACYAVMLAGREIDHIHVHHGYFGSWVGMTAARLLGVGFSITLHGSDLLLHCAYLDIKVAECSFCFTVSEYNRNYILKKFPQTDPRKVVVTRLGVEVAEDGTPPLKRKAESEPLRLLAVGRLHAVKDHEFLVRACAELHARGLRVFCAIAGEGPERWKLECLIRGCGLEDHISLLGHVRREEMGSLYDNADLVVLTSRSEGIPLVLMEAMARGRIVLAPAITGIPELVISGKTGFLYAPGAIEDFISYVIAIDRMLRGPGTSNRGASLDLRGPMGRLEWMSHAARVLVRNNFNRRKNLELFGDLFVERISRKAGNTPNENPVLQQVQLSLQRH